MAKHVLNYEISGSGPVVVLLHGYLSALRYWDDVRPELATNHTVITIDLLGFGGSPKPRKSNYDYDDHLRWLDNTLRSLDLDEPFVLAGHSMGALLALRYSLAHPNHIRRLLLMNPPLFKNAREARHQLSSSIFYKASLYWQLHRVIVPVMRLPVMKKLVRTALPPKYKGMEKYVFQSSVESRHRSLRNVIEAQESLYDLRRLNIPTTIVQGLQERPKYLENLLQVQAKPGLEIVLTDSGHHTPLDNAQLTYDLLQA
jgi:pimeloyl-ACP methyl ester carboxylesterase